MFTYNLYAFMRACIHNMLLIHVHTHDCTSTELHKHANNPSIMLSLKQAAQ